jgi:nucleoside-diphosphate-sugar epimerase
MILLTGGAGYIGSVLLKHILNKGEAVRVFDKMLFGEHGLMDFKGQVEVVYGDLRTIDEDVLEGIDSVMHFAGLSNDPMAEFNPKANNDINYVATKRFAGLCKKKGIRRFTFASSCSIYDMGLSAEDVLKDETSEVRTRATYAISKHNAEKALIESADENFCPVILRQGTVYGFSPRMRYDLVVNTFVKDALTKGCLNVFSGGEMWRPLIDVNDVAKAHILCIEAPEDKVRGEIFNLSYKNYRILELAHWVKEAFRNVKNIEINVDYSNFTQRSYRVSTRKIETVLGFTPKLSVIESVKNMINEIENYGYSDFDNPRYYNIRWLMLLSEVEKTIKKTGNIFDVD